MSTGITPQTGEGRALETQDAVIWFRREPTIQTSLEPILFRSGEGDLAGPLFERAGLDPAQALAVGGAVRRAHPGLDAEEG